jgi:DNA-binding GntR family transcriptional regulator
MSKTDSLTSDMLALWLKDEIRAGRFVPGQRLVEVDLTAATGATRAIIRKTFQKLAGEGIIVVEPHRGAMVRRLDREEIRDAYAVREVLEGLGARLAAMASDRQDLAKIIRSAEAAVEAGDRLAFIDVNRRWHLEIMRLASNPELDATLERSRVGVVHLLVRAFFNRPIIREAATSQARVTAAILDGDAERAERDMRAHVRGGLAAIERLLETQA